MAPRFLKPGEDFHFDPAFGFTGSARGRHDAMSHPGNPDDNEYGDGSFVENRPALAKEKGLARGGRAQGKPSPAHAYNDPKGYQAGGPAMPMPGRPTGVPAMGNAAPPGPAPAAGPMARAPAPMAPRPSPLAQGAEPGPLANASVTMPVHDAARLAHGLVQAGRVGGIRQAIGNAAAARGAAAARMAALAPGAAGSPVAAAPAPVAQQGVPAMAKGGKFIQGAISHPGRMQRGAKREGVSAHQYMEEHKDSPGSLGQAARFGLRLTGGDLSPRRKKK
jgi:hypothetical protein